MLTTAITSGRAVAVEYQYGGCPNCTAGGIQCDDRCPGCDAFFGSGMPAVPSEQMAPGEAESISPDSIMPDMTAPSPSSQDTFNLPSPSSPSLASSLGAPSGGRGIPTMIGDFFGGGYNYQFANGATVATAGGDRRFKFAENNNPFPTDRVFFNYHHFENAVTDIFGASKSLDRYTFGIEKTLFDGLYSVELRVPTARTVSANPDGAIPGSTMDYEFGNIALAVKRLISRGPCHATSMGLGVVFPTGDDFVIAPNNITSGPGFVPSNLFENEAVHLLPFFGAYADLTPRLFTILFTQLDFDPSGNTVENAGVVGVLQDQTLLFLDQSIGYWLHRDPCSQFCTALAPMVEMHYTTTLQDQDYGPFQGSGVFVEDFRRDVLHITGGFYAEFGRYTSIKLGAIAPLRTGSDRFFDSEIGLQVVHRY